jgi:hypothetical protein
MSTARNRCPPTALVLLLALGILIHPDASGSAAGEPKTRATKDGFLITLTVPVDIKGLKGRTWRNRRTGERFSGTDVAGRWEQGVEAMWNEGLEPYRYRGCYQFKIDIQLNLLDGSDDYTSDHHKIRFKDAFFVAPDSRSRVFTPGRPSKHDDVDSAYRQSLNGYWGRNSVLITAHEVGHLLGLADDYDAIENDDGSKSFKPLPGREGTIMARGTEIDQELADRIGDLVDNQLEMPPCIAGFLETSQEEQEGQRHSVSALDLIIEVKPDEQGEMKGTATGTFTLDGEVRDGSCSFTYGTAADVYLDLTADGSGDGPYTIQSTKSQFVQEVQRHYLCSQAYDVTIDWEILLARQGIVFEDAKYEVDDDDQHFVLTYLELEE